MGAGLKIDPSAGLKVEGRLFPHLLARSFSLPVPRPTAKLDPVSSAFHGGSFTESESSFDSDASSASLSFCALRGFQPCQTLRSMEEGVLCMAQEKNNLIPSEDYKPAPNDGCKHEPAADVLHRPSLTPFFDPSHRPILLPSPPLNSASSASCQLLDFFGENLAYIDESSDTLSDRNQPAAIEDRKRRPRKPKRKSLRRSPLHVERTAAEMQPPSNPPTPPPPPDSSFSDQNPTEPEETESN